MDLDELEFSPAAAAEAALAESHFWLCREKELEFQGVHDNVCYGKTPAEYFQKFLRK